MSPTCHSTFYMHDELYVFQVEDVLFRVHGHFLKKNSQYFKRLCAGDFWSIDAADGSEEHPYRLEGITVAQFESLCIFFYRSMNDNFRMSSEQWIALLTVSHKYHFTDAEKRATHEVYSYDPPLEPVIQIRIAEQHKVAAKFFVPALKLLVARAHPLRQGEVAQISNTMVAKIVEARELYLRKTAGVFGSSGNSTADSVVRQVWREAFLED
ncbi:hypothetical protein FA95DRAFT_1604310 [Auriscalpium vulgare]|uniref:Uncharacterized protein n=1 Tax=Auriscalpium vulgare TaxID=40419 RepID=A0ACB8S054_9AGAM|nr:hypothetical protein FA95DRAFT_1604310 [Auriscalpium vulgare]